MRSGERKPISHENFFWGHAEDQRHAMFGTLLEGATRPDPAATSAKL
jgi:hypothetical protein